MKKPFFQNTFSSTLLGIFLFTLSQGCKKDDPIPANLVPVANGGPSTEISSTSAIFKLSGSGTDADGTIMAYLWSQVSGPNHATIINPGSPSSDVKDFLPGE